jgi:hypothetical protein
VALVGAASVPFKQYQVSGIRRCQVSGFRLNIGLSEKALLWRLHHFNVKALKITLIIADTLVFLTPETSSRILQHVVR